MISENSELKEVAIHGIANSPPINFSPEFAALSEVYPLEIEDRRLL